MDFLENASKPKKEKPRFRLKQSHNEMSNNSTFLHLSLKRLITGPLGPFPWARARSCGSGGGTKTSVRPNGTPVMPVLRSRKTIQKVPIFLRGSVGSAPLPLPPPGILARALALRLGNLVPPGGRHILVLATRALATSGMVAWWASA